MVQRHRRRGPGEGICKRPVALGADQSIAGQATMKAETVSEGERADLTPFDQHFPSDDSDGALAVRYFSGKMSVAGGANIFPKNGRNTLNDVLARLFCICWSKLPSQRSFHGVC